MICKSKGQVAAFIVLFFLASCAHQAPSPEGKQGFYAITHMTNTPAAIDWSIAQGANAIEMDLTFDATGAPLKFYHGGLCDCLCSLGSKSSVCKVLSRPKPNKPCEAETAFEVQLKHVATKPELALVVLDNKVMALSPEAQHKAGAALITQVVEQMFGHDFQGKVVVGVAKAEGLPFLEAAARASEALGVEKRFYFTTDETGNDFEKTMRSYQSLNTDQLAYGTGRSGCYPGYFGSTMLKAANHEVFQPDKPVYVWTIDIAPSMELYINKKVNGIITNYPSRLIKVLLKQEVLLAKPIGQ